MDREYFVDKPEELMEFVLTRWQKNWDENFLFPFTVEARAQFIGIMYIVRRALDQSREETHDVFTKIQENETKGLTGSSVGLTERSLLDFTEKVRDNALITLEAMYRKIRAGVWVKLFRDPQNRIEEWR